MGRTMNRRIALVDRCLLWLLQARLSLFRETGDGADRFADRLVEVIQAEVERRNAAYADWNERAIRLREREAIHKV
jgi:hypothetical protein